LGVYSYPSQKCFEAIVDKINQDNLSVKCTLFARCIFKFNQKLAAFEVAKPQLLRLCLAFTEVTGLGDGKQNRRPGQEPTKAVVDI
jgi:hypothetical protein